MAAPMQAGRQSLAAQGRAVKQTRANYVGAAGNQQAPAPTAMQQTAAPAGVRPPPIAPVGMAPQPQPAAPPSGQVRDRRFAQGQAAYQQGAPPAPGMMPMMGVAKDPNGGGTGRIGNLPTTSTGAERGAGGNAAGWGGSRVSSDGVRNPSPVNIDAAGVRRSMAPQTLSALLGRNAAPGEQGLAPTAAGMVGAPAQQADATGTVKTGPGTLGTHNSAPQNDQHMTGEATAALRSSGNPAVDQAFRVLYPGADAASETADNGGGPGAIAGDIYGGLLKDIVAGGGNLFGPAAGAMTDEDTKSQWSAYKDVFAGLGNQDDIANSQYGSAARVAAEQAAKDEMNLGINTQRDSQMRELLGMQGRGGAVSQGQGNAINNSATMAQQAGERGLTQDAYERKRQATQDLLAQLQGTNDRRKGLHDESYTSIKDLLALGAEYQPSVGKLLGI